VNWKIVRPPRLRPRQRAGRSPRWGAPLGDARGCAQGTQRQLDRPVGGLGAVGLALRLILAGTFTLTGRAEVQIERTYLPLAAAPSSFAIGLPGGVNFCFDPVRGGVSYVWTGGFIDLTPARPGPGKFIAPAKLLGPVVYRETGFGALRRGDPRQKPAIEFTGYTLHDDAVEFRYTIDGVPVREEIRARTGNSGLTRKFYFNDGTDARWWQVVDGRPAIEIPRDRGGAGTLEILFAKGTP